MILKHQFKRRIDLKWNIHDLGNRIPCAGGKNDERDLCAYQTIDHTRERSISTSGYKEFEPLFDSTSNLLPEVFIARGFINFKRDIA